jgi:acyl-CoA synthetase (AMP-forming)/AMP-acid ligase II
MPSVLASGLIVELQTATSSKALVRTGGTGDITAQIKDIYFNLNCTTLNDSMVATLTDNASKNLLKYSYIDTYTARLTQSPNNQIVSTSISKAVSFADKINAVEIEQANADTQVADSFDMNSDVVDYQYTLGSIQLPSNVDVQGQKLSYIQSLATYGKLHETVDSIVKSPALRYDQWIQHVNTKTCSFSKNAYLALSQLAINSSRTLRYEQKYAVAPAEARLIFVFLKYVKVLSCSITDVDVSM